MPWIFSCDNLSLVWLHAFYGYLDFFLFCNNHKASISSLTWVTNGITFCICVPLSFSLSIRSLSSSTAPWTVRVRRWSKQHLQGSRRDARCSLWLIGWPLWVVFFSLFVMFCFFLSHNIVTYLWLASPRPLVSPILRLVSVASWMQLFCHFKKFKVPVRLC